MNSNHHRNSLAIVICFAIFCSPACNETSKEKQTVSDSANSSEHAHPQSPLADNEVKAEAPDAKIETEQGYARPRHSPEHSQSPINIISSKADQAGKQQFSLAFHSDFDFTENLGHTIQVDFKGGSTCAVNGKNYASRQLHFHTPSEHLIDGVTFPMEMHIVNLLNDSSNANKPSYLVLAVLFKMGEENKFIKEFLNKIPNKEGEKNGLQAGEVKLDDLFSQLTGNKIKSYYFYKGSLTTPPYSESVQWVILKHTVEASEEQIMTIEKLEGNNARHVQAINDRKVYTNN